MLHCRGVLDVVGIRGNKFLHILAIKGCVKGAGHIVNQDRVCLACMKESIQEPWEPPVNCVHKPVSLCLCDSGNPDVATPVMSYSPYTWCKRFNYFISI